MVHRNPELEAALCAELAQAFTDAHKAASKKPHSFVTSMYERYAEAFSKGARFYGPLAVIPDKGNPKYWTVMDIRHGWGYHPINETVYTEGQFPTLDETLTAVTIAARNFRSRAETLEKLVATFPKPEQE